MLEFVFFVVLCAALVVYWDPIKAFVTEWVSKI